MSEIILQKSNSPLSSIDCHFENYLKEKKSEQSKHIVGTNVMDYAYSVDLNLRKKLDSIPGLYTVVKRIASTQATKIMHKYQSIYLEINQNQFPEIYEISCECARILGIGVPNIFITNDDTFNAYAFGSDEIEPFILLGNMMVQRLSIDELYSIIGHECGHIQNAHIAYYTLASILVGTGGSIAASLLKQFGEIITLSTMMTLKMWQRAAEVTADRAGMICCRNLDSAYKAEAKTMYGALDMSDKISEEVSIDSIIKQTREVVNNPSKINELSWGHPITGKRIAAEMEFANCETFYSWRPDLRVPGQQLRSKALTDERCERIIEVF